MNSTRLLAVLAFTLLWAACVHTEPFASEYRQAYFLAEDVHLYSSASFTGLSSAWFTGPESVQTICSARRPRPLTNAATLKKGSPVKVIKIIHVAGIDASSCEAQLQIIDPKTHATHEVYIRWPGSKSLLTTKSSDSHP